MPAGVEALADRPPRTAAGVVTLFATVIAACVVLIPSLLIAADQFEEIETVLTGLGATYGTQTVNVLDKLPKTLHSQAKSALHAIWQAEIKDQADKAFDRFIATYEAKYPKATGCLAKDRDELLAFYDFLAAHWQHLRTSNPIESTFATIRLRTAKTRNCVSAKSGSALPYQLAMSAQKRWRRYVDPATR